MPRTPGVNSQHLWNKMDVPEWTGTCVKFQSGRLLMQRYQFTANYYKGNKVYGYLYEWAMERAKILAQRMKDHASACQICLQEKRFEDPNFYGVYK